MTDWKLPPDTGKRLKNSIFQAGYPQLCGLALRYAWTASRKKNSVVDNIPWRLAALEKNFLNFYIMHKSSEVLPAGRLHRLWLAGGESFQKPSQLLAGKRPYLRSVPRPLEFSIVQAFCAEHETRLVKVQGL